jgi:hypothetical protein
VVDFKLDTESHGSPYILVITRRPRVPASFKRRHKEWQDRFGVAKFILYLGVDALREFLGERFVAVMGLTWVCCAAKP